jgi:outer membrane protein assembly factor BamB
MRGFFISIVFGLGQKIHIFIIIYNLGRFDIQDRVCIFTAMHVRKRSSIIGRLRLPTFGILSGLTCMLAAVLFLSSCKKTQPASSGKEIISFVLAHADTSAFASKDISVTISGDTITVLLPLSTDLTKLIPQIKFKGVSISPATNVAQDFSVPVVYTVTAADNSKISYTVIVGYKIPASIVYFGGSDKSFYALDALTGELVWKNTTNGEFQYSTPSIDSGTVFVGCIDNNLYAFDALTGRTKWAYPTGGGIEAGTAVYNGTVYTGSDDHWFYAVDEKTGSLKWKYSTGGNVSSTPVASGGVVYFGSSDSYVYALDAATGNLKWKFEAMDMINQSAPALVNGVLYIGSRDSYLYALNAANGSLRWKFGTGGISLEESSPAVSGNLVYIGGWYDISNFSRPGNVYAVTVDSGKLAWQALDSLGFYTSPVVAGGTLYISADDGNFYALDASTGRTIWAQHIDPNGAEPAVAGGMVYQGGGGTRYFYAFSVTTGAVQWEYPMPNALMIGTAVVLATKKAYL